MYFRSLGVITDDQLILGLGIQPKVSGNNANLEASEGVPDGRELEQNPKQTGASSQADTEATHTNLGSGHHTLGLDIYDYNNPSEYGPSP
jgi:hypothetical protein